MYIPKICYLKMLRIDEQVDIYPIDNWKVYVTMANSKNHPTWVGSFKL
jgi:hypothetical protein